MKQPAQKNKNNITPPPPPLKTRKGLSLFTNIKSYFKHIKQSKLLHSEHGRSMTEMLGVLAIIGVLSIGGIMGYHYAMTKYKTNETLYELTNRAQVVNSEILIGHQTEFMGEFKPVTRLGYPITAALLEDPSYFELQIKQVPIDVCKEILRTPFNAALDIVVNDAAYVGDTSICERDDTQTPAVMAFQFIADLDENALALGKCKSDADCKGSCTACINERCVSTCSGDEKCAQQISTGEMLCCPKSLRDGPYCCNVKKNGMCCNAYDQCCPYYKPLADRYGTCYACDYNTAIDVKGVNDNCNVCQGRELYNNTCRLKCPADKPLRSYQGECYPCETPSLVSIVFVNENCKVCSNRTLSPNNQFCVLKCGKDKPVMDINGECHACEENTVWSMGTVTQNCALCPERTLIGTMCAPKVCPADKPLQDTKGTCYRCDEPAPVGVGGSADLCAACPERALGGAWGGFCILPCGTGINADKPLMDNAGRCYACDTKTPVSLGGIDTSICSRCDNTDTPREISGGYCVLKNMCKANQIKDMNGTCHDCEESAPFQTTTTSICRQCPNRVPGGTYNSWCSLPCDEGEYEGKPLPDARGVCHSCDEKADIFIYGVEVNCSICEKRSVKNNYCVLNDK